MRTRNTWNLDRQPHKSIVLAWAQAERGRLTIYEQRPGKAQSAPTEGLVCLA